jgi:hypothetical protein
VRNPAFLAPLVGTKRMSSALQRNVGALAGKDLLEIDWYFVPSIAARNRPHDPGAITGCRLLEPFGEGKDLEGAAGSVVVEGVASGFFYCADDINYVRPGNADDVIGLDVDILGRVAGGHNALDADGRNRELGQWNRERRSGAESAPTRFAG